ncbi:MAG TPA: tRNA 2-thiouridine(34) synthase MnmA [Candidatus Paceibacterota bacterium]
MLPIRTNIFHKARAARHNRVFVGMSGGVDSSVSAALLKRAGYNVTGVFIKVWQPDWIECNWREERLEAMRAAAHLDIPFVTLDLEREYKEGVIDYMIREYAAGRTPNPDVMCNREVKFGAFWKWAELQGADYIATGHYARNELGSDGSRHMRISKDLNKDQTYFLWTLTQADLKHVMFPVGHMTKDEVRAAAKKFELPNAEKKDSQGLCFIGKVDVKEFLQHYISPKPGIVLNEAGKEIGTHPGALLFTIGERHGFTISGEAKTPHDAAYYVVSKNTEANTITVSTKVVDPTKKAYNPPPSQSEVRSSANLIRVSWTCEPLRTGDKIQARSRYRETLQAATITSIELGSGTATVSFDTFQPTLTSGQSLVIYRDGECLGGGVIE